MSLAMVTKALAMLATATIKISDEAGHPYQNRVGRMVYPKGIPPQMSNDVIEQVKGVVATGALTPPRTRL